MAEFGGDTASQTQVSAQGNRRLRRQSAAPANDWLTLPMTTSTCVGTSSRHTTHSPCALRCRSSFQNTDSCAIRDQDGGTLRIWTGIHCARLIDEQLGRITHYAVDAVLISAFLAGVRRSTGLTYVHVQSTVVSAPDDSSSPEDLDVRPLMPD